MKLPLYKKYKFLTCHEKSSERTQALFLYIYIYKNPESHVCVCVESPCVYIPSSTSSPCFVLSGKCFANGMTTLWSMLLTWATICCMLKCRKPYKHLHSGSWTENNEFQWHFKQTVTFQFRYMSLLSYSLSNKTFNSFTMLPSSCTCVLLRKLWTHSYVTWRIFHSDTFPQFIPSPFFCYMIHKIAIRFRHWSSHATPSTPASISFLFSLGQYDPKRNLTQHNFFIPKC